MGLVVVTGRPVGRRVGAVTGLAVGRTAGAVVVGRETGVGVTTMGSD